jgi:alpha-ketoglutaric semialdehyde dehydrogenase
MRKGLYLNFIGGQWQEGSSKSWFLNRNPAKPLEIIGKSTCSNALDTRLALQSAQNALSDWSTTPASYRYEVINKAASLLREKLEFLAKTITLEEGKNLNESRREVFDTLSILEAAPSSTRQEGKVTGVITPWNFPLFLPTAHIKSSLIAGNTIVFKPSSLTPASAHELVKTFSEAGLPPGVLNLVYGSGHLIGSTLVSQLGVDSVTRISSRKIQETTPHRIFQGSDLDQGVEILIQSAFGLTGQSGMKSSRVHVARSLHPTFTHMLVSRARTIRVGDGLANPSAMGPVVDERHFRELLESITLAKQQGAQLICGGEPVGSNTPQTGYFVAPTIFDEVTPEMTIGKEDLLGPIIAIIPE